MRGTEELDRLVAETLSVSGRTQRAADAFGLAYGLGLVLKPRARAGAALFGRQIHFDERETYAHKQVLVGREIARWALRQWGLEESAAAISVVAGGLVAACAAPGPARVEPTLDVAQRA
jgi:hypothetical protein